VCIHFGVVSRTFACLSFRTFLITSRRLDRRQWRSNRICKVNKVQGVLSVQLWLPSFRQFLKWILFDHSNWIFCPETLMFLVLIPSKVFCIYVKNKPITVNVINVTVFKSVNSYTSSCLSALECQGLDVESTWPVECGEGIDLFSLRGNVWGSENLALKKIFRFFLVSKRSVLVIFTRV